MITLTTPEAVRTALGSQGTIGYDKMVLDNISHSPVNRTITAQVRLSVSTDSTQPVLFGTLVIDVQALKLTLTITNPVTFSHVTTLTGPQATTVQGWINTAEQNLEQGLLSVAAVTGTWSAGV